MSWKPNTPYLATDGIIEVYNNSGIFQGIVLIERKNEPIGLAIPGGFVDVGESTEKAVIREMKEETNLNVKVKSLLSIYSDPKRDERFHVASAVYICSAFGIPKSGDDAKEATIYKIENIPMDKLVFDHKEIIKDYISKQGHKSLSETI